MGLPCFLICRCLKVVKSCPVNPHLRCNYGCFYSIKKSASMPTPCYVKCALDSLSSTSFYLSDASTAENQFLKHMQK